MTPEELMEQERMVDEERFATDCPVCTGLPEGERFQGFPFCPQCGGRFIPEPSPNPLPPTPLRDMDDTKLREVAGLGLTETQILIAELCGEDTSRRGDAVNEWDRRERMRAGREVAARKRQEGIKEEAEELQAWVNHLLYMNPSLKVPGLAAAMHQQGIGGSGSVAALEKKLRRRVKSGCITLKNGG